MNAKILSTSALVMIKVAYPDLLDDPVETDITLFDPKNEDEIKAGIVNMAVTLLRTRGKGFKEDDVPKLIESFTNDLKAVDCSSVLGVKQ